MANQATEEEVRRATSATKEWHRIHARNVLRRALRHKSKEEHAKRLRRQRVRIEGQKGSFVRIPCPERLSFEEDYEGVLKLVYAIRNWSSRRRNERLYIDFTPIRTVTPSGALVLAAELDRWNSLPKAPRFRADTGKWAPNVRRLLGQMGFFELLKLDHVPDTASEGARYVKFRSGTVVDGGEVEALRELDLSPVVSVPRAKLLFAAVTEAMTNVVHHAYKNDDGGPKNWWLSAAHEADEVVILIYDQGAGIPKTLPLTLGERVRDWLPEGLATHDGRMIEVAHKLSRSGTGKSHRGRGLERDVRRYIEEHDGGGMYRVISGRGEYTVPAGLGAAGHVQSRPKPLKGTLIEWRLKLQ